MKGGEEMEHRSMFSTIFGRLFGGPRNLTRAKLLDGYSNTFIPFDGKLMTMPPGGTA